MITVEKIGQGTYFEDAFKLSFKYDPVTVGKVKELAQRRYLPEEKAWEIPAYELPNLVNKVGINNIKSDDAVLGALKTKEIEDRREATQEPLRNIKPSYIRLILPQLLYLIRLRLLTMGWRETLF